MALPKRFVRFTRKCDLCKEASFIPLPGPGNPLAVGWRVVYLADAKPFEPLPGTEIVTELIICPFCVAVARALEIADTKQEPAS